MERLWYGLMPWIKASVEEVMMRGMAEVASWSKVWTEGVPVRRSVKLERPVEVRKDWGRDWSWAFSTKLGAMMRLYSEMAERESWRITVWRSPSKLTYSGSGTSTSTPWPKGGRGFSGPGLCFQRHSLPLALWRSMCRARARAESSLSRSTGEEPR